MSSSEQFTHQYSVSLGDFVILFAIQVSFIGYSCLARFCVMLCISLFRQAIKTVANLFTHLVIHSFITKLLNTSTMYRQLIIFAAN